MGVADAAVVALLLLLGQTQVVLDVARLLVLELGLRLLLDAGFYRFSNFSLWHALNE